MAALLLLGLGARMLRSHHGLPYLDHWDEPTIGNRSLSMLKSGEYNPRFFNYPSLLFYLNLGVDIAHYLRLAGLPRDHPDSLPSLDSLELGESRDSWFISHPTFYLWKRWLVCLFGVATVIAAALFAATMSRSRWAPHLAALLLATLPTHIWHSSVLTTDVPAACWAAFAVLFCLRFEKRTDVAALLAAATLAGLAASTKYNLGTVAIFPLVCLSLAAWRKSPGYRPWLWLALPAATGLAFLAGTPYAVLDLRAFVDDIGHDVHHYVASGHGPFTATPGWSHLRLDLIELGENLGWPVLLLCVYGLVICLRRSGGWLLLAAPLLQLLLTARTVVHFHRNLMLLYPFLAAGFGIGSMALVQALERRLRDRQWLRWGRLTLLLLAGAWAAVRAHEALTVGWRAFTFRDSRSKTVDRLQTEYPERQVWLASELRWHPRDLQRLERPYRLMPALEVLCRRRPEGTLAVSGIDYRYQSPSATPLEVTLNGAVGDLSAALVLGKSPTFVDRFSVNPRIAVWERTDLGEREVCSILSPIRLADGSAGRLDPQGIWLRGGQLAKTAPTAVFPAPLALRWNEKDLTGALPELEVQVVFTALDSVLATVVAQRTYLTRPAGRERELTFRIEKPGTVSVHLKAAKDGTTGDSIWVRKLGFAYGSDGPAPRQ